MVLCVWFLVSCFLFLVEKQDLDDKASFRKSGYVSD